MNKEKISFISQLRYFANNAFEKGEEVEVAELFQIKSKKNLFQKYLENSPIQRSTNLAQCASRKRNQKKVK